jgi:hypothetical protein
MTQGSPLFDAEGAESSDATTGQQAEAKVTNAPKPWLSPLTWMNSYRWAHAVEQAWNQNTTLPAAIEEARQKLTFHSKVPVPHISKLAPAIENVAKIIDEKNIHVPSNIMYVRFSKPFLEQYFCKEIRRQLKVNDTMFGAPVRGKGLLVGATQLQLIEDPTQVHAILSFKGKTTFQTTCFHDPVRVHSKGKTSFESKKRLHFDGKEILQGKPVTQAETNTQVTGVDTDLPGIRRNIAIRAAHKRAAEQIVEAERITNERTKSRIETAFTKALKERADRFSDELKTQFAKLPFDGRFALEEIQCSTTSDQLQIVVVGRGDKEPMFVPPPAALAGQPDIEVHLHATLVQKAILDPSFREALQLAVNGIVERPIKLVANTIRKSGEKEEPQPKMEIQWLERDDLSWIGLAWHAEKPETKTEKSDRASKPAPARVTVNVKP